MSIIVTADIHLTDAPRDEHRWGLFQFLAEQADEHGADTIIICGDLTDAKDRHPARLVNDMVLGFQVLAGKDRRVYVLRGNHDYIEESEPFFGFASALERVRFITKPTEIGTPKRGKVGDQGGFLNGPILLLPNTRQPEVDWAQCVGSIEHVKLIFCHQTFAGAKAENGFVLPGGIDPGIFGKTKAKIISGDIHSQQIVSRKPHIEYVGAPYRCRFGDSFEPRCLLICDDGSTQDLHFETKNKHLLEIDGLNMRATSTEGICIGDQVKVRVRLPRSAYLDWPKIRKSILTMADNLQWELTGPELIAAQEKPRKGQPAPESGSPSAFSPEQALGAYAQKKGLSGPLLAAGEGWLKEARK